MYVKKPIPIEARQITAENVDELAAWSKSDVIRRPVDGSISGLMVYTLEGQMTGSVGDYLMKGVRGEFYFCAKDIFEETYEEYQEPLDPWHIEVFEVCEHQDGSASFEFILGEEAKDCFLRIGILKGLQDQVDRVLAKELDIDTNVGC
jgi:hypothetical protein